MPIRTKRTTTISGRPRVINSFPLRFPCLRATHLEDPDATRFEVTYDIDAIALGRRADEPLKQASRLVTPPLPLTGGQVKLYLPGGDVESRLHQPSVNAFEEFMDEQAVPVEAWNLHDTPVVETAKPALRLTWSG
jgi:hypothetical protein